MCLVHAWCSLWRAFACGLMLLGAACGVAVPHTAEAPSRGGQYTGIVCTGALSDGCPAAVDPAHAAGVAPTDGHYRGGSSGTDTLRCADIAAAPVGRAGSLAVHPRLWPTDRWSFPTACHSAHGDPAPHSDASPTSPVGLALAAVAVARR